jgi:hypothetical protein
MRRLFAPDFVNNKKGCTRLAAASDKVYHLLAHGRWFSPASSTTKTGLHDIADILLKVALNTIKSINQPIHLFVRALETGRKSEQLVNCYCLFCSECKLILYLTKMYILFCLSCDIKKSKTPVKLSENS